MDIEKEKKRIGKETLFKWNNLSFKITILDVRRSTGHIEYLIKPISGSGQDWVRSLEKKNKILKK